MNLNKDGNMFLGLRAITDIKWIDDIAKAPIVGNIFLFVFMFVPAVLASFLAQAIIPGINNDVGFTKAMLILLPGWNLFLWVIKIRLYLFFLPSWVLLGGIALVKGILLIAGISDGQ
ncbi:hypothetical protein [Pinibacter aurantiacus]|uniref:Uncharacterized protein n=1 Tax=Pinibacter aurantiacus TaxID=2851599 RepID=A0A9E2W7N1_9BACT|nr:hypothetical protein [Pinibacter aurantiacus]MBV4356956.1 hypothetical protein [Pinibacter aurantiacus]